MNPLFHTQEPTSEQQVADTLRNHILAGELPVGEFLSQRKPARNWSAFPLLRTLNAPLADSRKLFLSIQNIFSEQ
jgi:hypothetical protein